MLSMYKLESSSYIITNTELLYTPEAVPPLGAAKHPEKVVLSKVVSLFTYKAPPLKKDPTELDELMNCTCLKVTIASTMILGQPT
jgi:hypothetical protein